ncbi:hypothetical protein [Sphingobium sp. CFD-2]|uniref:hypothetical protein n=1 Tax=Sphingobium sp. CFD-2 TaxID=2878542 RepID=UPI00214B5819|nr:hypothetical protein [Sphingobium sp. CFD-2]
MAHSNEDGGERYELCSPQWLDAMREYYRTAFESKDLLGFEFIRTYEFTNPPQHLRKPGRETIGYALSLKDGRMEVIGEPLPLGEAQSVVLTDYDASLQLRQWDGSDPAYPAFRSTIVEAGKLKFFGDPPKLPAAMENPNTHNALSAFTRFPPKVTANSL